MISLPNAHGAPAAVRVTQRCADTNEPAVRSSGDLTGSQEMPSVRTASRYCNHCREVLAAPFPRTMCVVPDLNAMHGNQAGLIGKEPVRLSAGQAGRGKTTRRCKHMRILTIRNNVPEHGRQNLPMRKPGSGGVDMIVHTSGIRKTCGDQSLSYTSASPEGGEIRMVILRRLQSRLLMRKRAEVQMGCQPKMTSASKSCHIR